MPALEEGGGRSRRALLIAYFFPPLGGAGVQRTAKFAKYLPRSGWNTTVLTVASGDYWMHDSTLLADLPSGQEVLRTRSITGVGLFGGLERLLGRRGGSSRRRSVLRLARLAQWILIPDTYVGWVPFAARAAAARLRRGDVDLLYTTSSPDSAHLVGLLLGRRTVPWVADFRDPWTRRLTFEPPTPFHRRLHEWLEDRVLESADRIIVTSERTAAEFRARHPRLPASKIVTITNGFDEDDFAGGPPVAFTRPTLVHTGQLTGRRTIEPLLSGLAALAAKDPEGKCGLSVLLIGPREAENEERVRRRGLEHVVRFLEPMPHREVIRFQQGATALLLLEGGDERGRLILPGKVFEYLASRRPILAIAPGGAVHDLLQPLGQALFASPEDPTAIASALDAVRRGDLPQPCDPAALNCFSRLELTGRLARLFDEVVKVRAGQAGLRI
jgi:glycosyltransferase involved in cell wall biosynthesis